MDTNPGCYGKSLAAWLCDRFKALGYQTEVIPEDWGWCVMCESNDYLLWVGCGAMQNEEPIEDQVPDLNDVVWHVFACVEVPSLFAKIRRWRGKLDTEKPLEKLGVELKQVLESEPGIVFCEEP